MRVVLDTNILISALLSARGLPAEILRLERQGGFDLVFSPDTVSELWRVLNYPKIQKRLGKLGIPAELVERYLKNLIRSSVVTPGKLKMDIIKDDPSDNIFLACALEGKADFIVSGDSHLKELEVFRGIPILGSAEFIKMAKNF